MTHRKLPSPELLRKLLRYEPETGMLFWRERHEDMFTDSSQLWTKKALASQWNARHAGKEAFTSSSSHGYKNGAILGLTHTAHRVAWVVHYGEWPKGEIDHINGVRNDNRASNLRDVSRIENRRNASMNTRNKSGTCGVAWHARDKKWCAKITRNYKQIHLGCFECKFDAVLARLIAENKYGFHPNHGRMTH